MKKIRVKAKAVAGTHEWGLSNTNTEQVGMRVEVLDGEFAGQSLTWYGYFTEASEQRTLEQLEIAGWDKSSVIDLPGLGSTEFELILEEQEGLDKNGAPNGEMYWRPTFINRIGVAMRNKMDDAQKRAFAARIGALVGAGRPARPAQRPAGRPAPASNGGTRMPADYVGDDAPMPDDDIPF